YLYESEIQHAYSVHGRPSNELLSNCSSIGCYKIFHIHEAKFYIAALKNRLLPNLLQVYRNRHASTRDDLMCILQFLHYQILPLRGHLYILSTLELPTLELLSL